MQCHDLCTNPMYATTSLPVPSLRWLSVHLAIPLTAWPSSWYVMSRQPVTNSASFGVVIQVSLAFASANLSTTRGSMKSAGSSSPREYSVISPIVTPNDRERSDPFWFERWWETSSYQCNELFKHCALQVHLCMAFLYKSGIELALGVYCALDVKLRLD